jgi:PIN domain nuclease of toxin-antitoxin system
VSCLLDTHILLWWFEAGITWRTKSADPSRRPARPPLLVSDISLWEIATLTELGRIRLTLPLREWLEQATAPPLVRCDGISPAVAAELAAFRAHPTATRPIGSSSPPHTSEVPPSSPAMSTSSGGTLSSPSTDQKLLFRGRPRTLLWALGGVRLGGKRGGLWPFPRSAALSEPMRRLSRRSPPQQTRCQARVASACTPGIPNGFYRHEGLAIQTAAIPLSYPVTGTRSSTIAG